MVTKTSSGAPVILLVGFDAGTNGGIMTVKRSVGRPAKVDYRIMIKLADALQHSATVSDACRYANISRDTFYRHVNGEPEFAEKMRAAKADQYKLISFLTLN